MATQNIETQMNPILVSVIQSRLDAISREIGETMLRTSRSPIFSEARDFVTGIFDSRLRLIAQTAYIPVLMGALPAALEGIVSHFGEDIDDGDVFILNDPYHGNNHAPDVTVAKPVFTDGEIRFWVVAKGHHADVGGGGVVGYNPSARSVWDECFRIPPGKLLIKGKRNETLWDLLLLNLRMSWLVEGDLNCQIGACTLGERSLKALIAKYSVDILEAAALLILDASDKQMRAALATVPNGTYTATRFIDNDGIDHERQIKIALALTFHDGTVHFDWSQSSDQVAGFVNSTLPNTFSASAQALFMTICTDVRYNEGAIRAMTVDAPLGSVLNPREPAPVTACTVITAEAMIETVWLALSQIVPDRVYACWGRWHAPSTMGLNPSTGRLFGDIHFMAKSGAGASKGSDGWDHLGTVICAGGLRSPDPELHEMVNPYRLLKYEYWPDSAGAGQWRGGMGTILRWRVEADEIAAVNFGGGNHAETRPFGINGGAEGPSSIATVHHPDGTQEVIDGGTFFTLNKGDEIELRVTGGGGYGDPRKRDRARVAQDLADGLVSKDAARSMYGFN